MGQGWAFGFVHSVAPVVRDVEIPGTQPLCGSVALVLAAPSVGKLCLRETGFEWNVSIRCAMTLALLLWLRRFCFNPRKHDSAVHSSTGLRQWQKCRSSCKSPKRACLWGSNDGTVSVGRGAALS